ncbi:retrovirus-related pol polyprotein from transposon TNT 1-94 [Tanacetum coccineum]
MRSKQSRVINDLRSSNKLHKRGSYIPWAISFRRYLNRKRENRKWLNKAIDEGPYEFKELTPSETEEPRMQTEEDLRGDDLKHYAAEIEAMNLILISIPNDIYNFMDACKTAQAMWQRVEFRLAKILTEDTYDDLFDYLQQFEKLVNASRAKKLEKSHDPLALVAHTGSSSRTTSPYYVTHPSSVVDYDDDYQGDAIQSRNSGNDDRNTRRSYVQEEVIEGTNVQNDAGNIQRTLRTTSSGTAANVQCYNCSEKGHYARNCPKPRNDFLFSDATRMEEIEELSVNICLMARIQSTNFDSDAGPSYDFVFLSEVQIPSTSYVNSLFAKDKQEQKYLKQPKFINNIIGDDQIDSNIIFDEPNEDVNSGSVEYDNNVQESYELEQLARNTYKEAEKQ